MAILEQEVSVLLSSKTIKYYRELGYEIPISKNNRGIFTTPRGTSILVEVCDLQLGSRQKVTKVCDICGKISPDQPFQSIITSRKSTDGKDRCSDCGSKYSGKTKKSGVQYEKSLEYYALNNDKEYLLKEFNVKNKRIPSEISHGDNDLFLWNCPKCKSEYDMELVKRTFSASNCPYCAGMRVNHTNCLWTTHPDVAKLLKYKENGYKITHGSHKKEEFICVNCNLENTKIVKSVVQRGLSCVKCSDGLSYPEKIIINMLNQLNIKYKKEKVFGWAQGRRYDFYIPTLNCIIEAHGGQHYVHTGRGKSLQEEQENDKLKEFLANKNGITHYIIINCEKSELNYIKNNVINNLSKLIDLSNVNWLDCHKGACKSLVKEACEIWNGGIRSSGKIAEILNISLGTVSKYLKQGSIIGWCTYDPREVQIISGKNIAGWNAIEIVQLSIDGQFIKEWESSKSAESVLKIWSANITGVCRGKLKTAGGYRWMYKKDYILNKNNLKPHKTKTRAKAIVRLDLNGNYVDEYESGSDASKKLNIHKSKISLVCNRKRDHAGGFKWMFKDDYVNT